MGQEPVRGRGRIAHLGGHEFRIGEPRVIDRVEAGGQIPRLVRFLSARMGLRQFVLMQSESE